MTSAKVPMSLRVLLIATIAFLVVLGLYLWQSSTPEPMAIPKPVVVPELNRPKPDSVLRRDVAAPAPVKAPAVEAQAVSQPKPTTIKHKYDDNPDIFIRQPIDYPPDMPRRMGDKISICVFDLELVKEAIRTGNEPGSKFAKTLGRQLSEQERTAARAALQAFFDEGVPVMDSLMLEQKSLDEGFEFFQPRRQQLNQELRKVMNLSQEEFYKLYPHIKSFDEKQGDIEKWKSEPIRGHKSKKKPE